MDFREQRVGVGEQVKPAVNNLFAVPGVDAELDFCDECSLGMGQFTSQRSRANVKCTLTMAAINGSYRA